jgi:hypothetical protein
MRTAIVTVASCFVALSSTASEARRFQQLVPTECNMTMPCDFSGSQTARTRTATIRSDQSHFPKGGHVVISTNPDNGQVIGGRPGGCPHAYCGCAASLRVFGRIVPGLNLASSWLRFPRTSPAPGMVAARHGHVFVLESHVEGDTWMAYDGNSGGHATRIHARSLHGYTVVNPRGASYASLQWMGTPPVSASGGGFN